MSFCLFLSAPQADLPLYLHYYQRKNDRFAFPIFHHFSTSLPMILAIFVCSFAITQWKHGEMMIVIVFVYDIIRYVALYNECKPVVLRFYILKRRTEGH